MAGRYVVERELGRGGMATVFLARDLRHARAVALKVMMRDLVASAGAERFLQEIQFAARLTHPHVLGVHDSGEADGLLYYVMPYLDGETLRARLERDGALPRTVSVRVQPADRSPLVR
ncbi:MAG TPA: protein kinase [Gemmatimonadaceae bacterium]|nr:protein kinase [Gemmatimonadaceae bacterium]